MRPRPELSGKQLTLHQLHHSGAVAAPSEIRSVSVDTSGIDLTTEAGTDVMLAKLRRAAEKACDQRTGPMSLSERSAYQSCYNDAMSAALDSLTTATERQADLKAKQNG